MKKVEEYAVYSPTADMTFIVKSVFIGEEIKSTEVVGFHFGEPYEDSVKHFSGKRKAKFKW